MQQHQKSQQKSKTAMHHHQQINKNSPNNAKITILAARNGENEDYLLLLRLNASPRERAWSTEQGQSNTI